MPRRIRLQPGRYVCKTSAVVSLLHHGVEKEYTEYRPGEVFDVPRHVDGFWSALTYHPDFDDRKPEVERAD